MIEDSLNKHSLDELLVDPSFQDWVLGRASSEENELWETSKQSDPENKQTFDEAAAILKNLHFKETALNESLIDQKYNQWRNSIRPTRVLHKLWNAWAKAAAVILLPLCLYFIINNQYFSKEDLSSLAQSEIISAPGTRSMHTLSDGTRVWLNSGSKLAYSANFNHKERKVHIEGEAYFDVSHNKQKPFIVEAGQLEIKVLGTEFNVSAYKDDHLIETTLVNGSIELTEANSGKTVKLAPKQNLRVDKKINKMTVKNVNPELYSSWKDGKLIFENEPFNDLIRKLSRWYNVDIELESENLEGFRFTAIIQNETLQQTLELIKISTPIDYKFISAVQLQDSSYSSSKVVISNTK